MSQSLRVGKGGRYLRELLTLHPQPRAKSIKLIHTAWFSISILPSLGSRAQRMVLLKVTVGLSTSANPILIVYHRQSQVLVNLDSSSHVFLGACLLDVKLTIWTFIDSSLACTSTFCPGLGRKD